MVPVLKTDVRASVPWVRIPLRPRLQQLWLICWWVEMPAATVDRFLWFPGLRVTFGE